MEYKWLLFCPQFPATPSSPRVTVWRRMRAAGSVGLDNGLWILPNTVETVKFIQEINDYVEIQGGSSRVFLADAFDASTEADILARFRQDRAQEYSEIVEQCQDFIADIDKECQRRNYSFAEYEENEQDLNKLEIWYEKVKKRDILGGDEAAEAMAGLEKCRQALQKFAMEVFNHEKYDS
jgi:hypothetical protein